MALATKQLAAVSISCAVPNSKILNTSPFNDVKRGQIMDGEAPTGVKVISVLYYIGAVFELIFAILLFVGSGTIKAKVPLLAVLGPFLIVGGIILLGLAVLSFFVGLGLWKGKKWARIVAIIFAAIGVLLALVGMLQGQIVSNILGLVISAGIGGYLLFSSGVKSAFA